jgi:hypothetical protein
MKVALDERGPTFRAQMQVAVFLHRDSIFMPRLRKRENDAPKVRNSESRPRQKVASQKMPRKYKVIKQRAPKGLERDSQMCFLATILAISAVQATR